MRYSALTTAVWSLVIVESHYFADHILDRADAAFAVIEILILDVIGQVAIGGAFGLSNSALRNPFFQM